MPAMSFTEKLGFIDKVIEALKGMRKKLAKMGINAGVMIAELEELRDRVVTLNEKQEILKRETKRTTVELNAVTGKAYHEASGTLNTMIAAEGNTGPNAKSLAQIRALVLRPRQSRGRAKTKSA